MPARKRELRIHGTFQPDTYARYHRVKESLAETPKKVTDEQCHKALLDAWEQGPILTSPDDVLNLIGYKPSEIEALTSDKEKFARQQGRHAIEVALARDPNHFWEWLRHGLEREVRLQNTDAAKLPSADFDATTVNAAYGEMRRNRIRGSSDIRIKQFIDKIMEANLHAETQWDIVYITRGIVRDATKIDTTAIAKYFDAHADELDAHHESVGIGSTKAGIFHNRKRKTHLQEKGGGNGTTILVRKEKGYDAQENARETAESC
jgi:hypothetical protein